MTPGLIVCWGCRLPIPSQKQVWYVPINKNSAVEMHLWCVPPEKAPMVFQCREAVCEQAPTTGSPYVEASGDIDPPPPGVDDQ